MSNHTSLDQLTDRVERLLLRYEELQRAYTLLKQDFTIVEQERDSLKSRLAAARARIDVLLERLPSPMLSAEVNTASNSTPAPHKPPFGVNE